MTFSNVFSVEANTRMSNPIRQHYLAQAGYLRFFTVPDSDRVFQYKRGKRPVSIGVRDAGLERHLYSFVDADGKRNYEIETKVFAPLDGKASEIMAKLNIGTGSVSLTETEAQWLLAFIAFQAVRTPAFRDMLLRFDADYLAKSRATNSDLRAQIRRDFGDVSEDEVEAYCEAVKRKTFEVTNDPRYWLRRMARFVQLIQSELAAKSPEILRSPDEVVITCDHPVVADYDSGFAASDVILPIGSHSILVCHAAAPWIAVDGGYRIPARCIGGARTRELNLRVMTSAEVFLFAAVAHDRIAQRFERSPRPRRMHLPD